MSFDAIVSDYESLREAEKENCGRGQCTESSCEGPMGHCWIQQTKGNRKQWDTLLQFCNPLPHDRGFKWIKTRVPCTDVKATCDIDKCAEGTIECNQGDRPLRKDSTKTNFYAAKGSCRIEKHSEYTHEYWEELKKDCDYPNERPGYEDRPYGQILEEQDGWIRTNTPCWQGNPDLNSQGVPLDKFKE